MFGVRSVVRSAPRATPRCVRLQCYTLQLFLPGRKFTVRGSVPKPTLYRQFRKVVWSRLDPGHVNGVLVGSVHI